MKIAIFGLGYVGFTAMCCIASGGHFVIGFDPNESKIQQIRSGQCPITEPELQALLDSALEKGLIEAHTSVRDRLAGCDVAVVCVGTPSAPDGSHNMTYIAEVSRQIAAAVDHDRKAPLTVVYRSTIRPGTIEALIQPIFVAELGANFERLIELVYNPEFLREATAVRDYFEPPKIVVGTKDGMPCRLLDNLYDGIVAPIFNVRYREAEITKFVDNTWHAAKVAYANEVGRVCLQLGISASIVHEIFISDTKLNVSSYYLRPGGAFGGSCLPKDVRAFQYIAADCGANTHLVDSLLRSNDAHKYRLYEHVSAGLKTDATVLLVGIAFKENSDDLRESPNIDLARNLLRDGYKLSIFDPGIDAGKLVGANLGYAFTRMPTLYKLLVTKEVAEETVYDRVIFASPLYKLLQFKHAQNIVNIDKLQ